MILPILALKGHHYYPNITGSGGVAEKGCYAYMHHTSLNMHFPGERKKP